MSTNNILEFQNISFNYPASRQAVMEGFSLQIQAGTVTAILGPNGAGKTTLLHIALGWLKPQAGNVLIDDLPLNQFTRRELGKRMGLVPQNENVAFEYSLTEFILLGRAPHLPPLAMPGEADIEIAVQALEQVGLTHLKRRSILSISGGERQLTLAARALAQQPGLLLLDEPTSHLDLGNKVRLIHLLQDLQHQGVTIVFTTHEPEVASALATHLVLMQKGKILKTGRLEEVFTSQDLSVLYQSPVKVIEVDKNMVALWT
jgi:iron complex transport system ATP-binding protein